MREYPQTRINVGLTVACLVLLLLGRWHIHYGASVDFGMHYALTNYLYSMVTGEFGSGEFLGGMKDYPPGSHWIAAILAVFTHSPLVAINVLTIVATFGGFLAISMLVTEGPPLKDIVRLIAMLATIVALRLENVVFGSQVIQNFFFPQLLGEAIALGGIFWLSTEKFVALSHRTQGIALLAGCWMLGWVQPLAAIQFGLTAAVFALFMGWKTPGNMASAARLLLIPFAFAVAMLAGVLANPAMWFMSKVAAHDGSLGFGAWITPKNYQMLVFVSCGAAALSIYGAKLGRLRRPRAFVLAAACVAGSCLLLIQQAALAYLGAGSTYAVGKHVFFLTTFTMTTLAYALVGLLPGSWSFTRFKKGMPRIETALPATFATVAVLTVFGGAKVPSHSLLPLIEYQSNLRSFIPYAKERREDGRTLSFNRSLSNYDNFLVSYGDLRMPSYVANSIFEEGIPANPLITNLIVSRIGADQDVIASCAIGPQLSLRWSAVSRDCAANSLSRLTLNDPVTTVDIGRGRAFLSQGWSTPEPWGTWSVGKNAVIKFTVPDKSNSTNSYRLRVRYRPFILDRWPVQQYTVVLDGKINQEIVVKKSDASEFSIGPFGAGDHVVELRIATARSPRELGSSLDPRELGIGVTAIELIEAGAR